MKIVLDLADPLINMAKLINEAVIAETDTSSYHPNEGLELIIEGSLGKYIAEILKDGDAPPVIKSLCRGNLLGHPDLARRFREAVPLFIDWKMNMGAKVERTDNTLKAILKDAGVSEEDISEFFNQGP